MIPYSYLFDNNLYRHLTTSKDGQALKNFNKAIDQVDILKKIASHDGVAIRMTPFTIMEAIGITAPDPALIPPRNLLQKGKGKDLFNFISSQSKLYYQNSPVIKREYLLEKAKEQSKFTSYEASEFEKICIFNPLSDPSLETYFIDCLTFDYLCKFDYPKDLQVDIFHKRLIPFFFIDEATIVGLSKFRLAKKLWDIAYPQLLAKGDYSKLVVEEMNKSMRIKKLKDFLDCELIHFVCIGDSTKQDYKPVVAYTCDDEQTIINRIMTYKSIIILFINLLDDNTFEQFKETIGQWKPGIVVICNSDGSFKKIIEVDKVPIFE